MTEWVSTPIEWLESLIDKNKEWSPFLSESSKDGYLSLLSSILSVNASLSQSKNVYVGLDKEKQMSFERDADSYISVEADRSIVVYSTMKIEGNYRWDVDDIIRIKSKENVNGTIRDEWMKVTATAHPEYTVLRDIKNDYTWTTLPVWKKGAAVVNYGQGINHGGLSFVANGTALKFDVFSFSATPYYSSGSKKTHIRAGNLKGFLNYTSTQYGIAIGEASRYMTYDPASGLRIKGQIISDYYSHSSSPLMIDGGQIYANTIGADAIAANSISATELVTRSFVTSSANIATGIITDAKIISLSASKLSAGSIKTSNITIKSGDKSTLIMQGNRMYITDASGNLRVDVGEVATDTYGLKVYTRNGSSVMTPDYSLGRVRWSYVAPYDESDEINLGTVIFQHDPYLIAVPEHNWTGGDAAVSHHYTRMIATTGSIQWSPFYGGNFMEPCNTLLILLYTS